MSRIKIVEKGWQGYNGPLGSVHFKDGISTNSFSHAEGLRIGAVLRIVEIDEHGDEVGPVGLSHEFGRISKLGLKASHETMTLAQAEAARAEAREEPKDEPKPVAQPSAFDRAALEAIADAKGIKGLREIADPLGAKSNSIPALIDAILEAQA